MDQPPYELDAIPREVVRDAIAERCEKEGWQLLAAHVRTNHVHVVVASEHPPEYVMTQLKCAASRELNRQGLDEPTRKRWSRHGSTRTLFNTESVENAIAYVLGAQGDAMSTFSGDRSRRSRL